jgi:hypothetical protein
MWEKYAIAKMDEADLDLRAIKIKIGEKRFNKFMRFFKNIAKNTQDALKESQIYLTQESIQKKLRTHLGHKCDFL